METQFNPFPVRQFSKAQVAQLFGPTSDARLAQKTRTENPALYAAIRKQAVADGLVGVPPVPYSNWRMPKERKFSDQEIIARSKFSEEECRSIFCKANSGDQNNAGNLFKNDPQKYAEMRAAAVSYGLIPATQPAPIVHTDKPATEPEGVVLSDDNADRLNLPRGTKVSAAQYEQIVTILNPAPKE